MFKKKLDLKLLVTTFIILLFVTIVGIAAVNSSYAINNSIYGGVKVANLDLDGLTQKQAAQVIKNEVLKIAQKPIIKIKFQDKTWNIDAKDIDWHVNAEELSLKAYMIGRTGNFFEQLKERFYTYNQGRHISLLSSYNENKLRNIINEIAKKLYAVPENASVSIIAGKQEIIPEINGILVNEDEALKTADKTINNNLSGEMVLPAKITPPAIIEQDLEEITDILASYTTYFNPRQIDRSYNVSLATKSVDNILLRPEDVFSFNKSVGPRTAANGFRDAPVYIGDEVVPGIGGGICQVSSTLYNAALYSNLVIVERENHIRPVPYAPIGQDATIAGDVIDLKFKNNTSNNIYIRSKINYNEMTVEILGKKPDDFPTIKIIAENMQVTPSKSVVKQDKDMPLGEKKVDIEGANGYKVTTYRLKYQGNKLVAKEKLYYDIYPVINEVVKVGAKLPDNAKNKDKDTPEDHQKPKRKPR